MDEASTLLSFISFPHNLIFCTFAKKNVVMIWSSHSMGGGIAAEDNLNVRGILCGSLLRRIWCLIAWNGTKDPYRGPQLIWNWSQVVSFRREHQVCICCIIMIFTLSNCLQLVIPHSLRTSLFTWAACWLYIKKKKKKTKQKCSHNNQQNMFLVYV
jgi:hypothetical protein